MKMFDARLPGLMCDISLHFLLLFASCQYFGWDPTLFSHPGPTKHGQILSEEDLEIA